MSVEYVERELWKEPWMETLNGNLEWEPWMGTLDRNLEWESGEKPPNPIKENEEENRKTNENILAM